MAKTVKGILVILNVLLNLVHHLSNKRKNGRLSCVYENFLAIYNLLNIFVIICIL
jgi:hypothetical protein